MSPPDVGTLLGGRYRLDERIAGGGMGEVWAATDDVLGRRVAVKVLKRELADDPSFLERFRAEARHTAALSHPGIAAVFDYGEDDGASYLVMELVPGSALSELVRRGPLPPEQALSIAGQAAMALEAAHDAGVVHRDVKPGNLLVCDDGTVKVTDFGIARAAGAVPLTHTGTVLGTAHYISPEQAAGGEATPASDVYSLGLVLFECLTGRRAFAGDNPVAVALAQVHEPPPALPAAAPGELRALVEQSLAKDPAGRPGTAGDFGRRAIELGTALAGVPPLPEAGSAATTAVLDEPAPTVAAAPEATRVLTTTTTTGRRGTPLRDMGRHPLLAVAVVAVLFLGTLAVVAAVADGQHAPPAHGATAPATPRPTPTPTPSATPQATVRAADYVGKPYDEAKAALERLGLRVARAEQVSSRAPDTVMAVSPTGVVPVPSTVTLTVAKAPPPPPGGDGKGDKGHGKGKKH